MTATTSWAAAHPYAGAAVAAVLLAAAVIGLRSAARAVRKIQWRAPAAVVVAALAAAACTAYSADTSWRFAAHRLDMASPVERAAMFFAAELALFSCALMARQNLRTAGAPGTPGLLVWGITGVQVIPAYAESGIVGGTVRAVVGPILAALLWHLAMGIELRHAKPGAGSQSLPAVVARELRERLLSRLGLAVRDRSAEQILRDRWTVRAVALAARLADVAPEKRDTWRARRTARLLSVAVGRAQAGADPGQRRMLLDLLAARRHATNLATVPLPSPWQTDDMNLRRRFTICSGPTGMLFLQRPKPIPSAAPTKPAGPVGSRVDDVAALLAGQHAPVVYFIRNGDRVKIGTSQNLRNRVRQLCLRVEDIVLVLHGDLVLERKLHEQFAEHRVGDSEWFGVADNLADYLATATGQPVANTPTTGAAPVASASASSAPTGDSGSANTGPVPAPVARQRPRRPAAKKAANTRRPMGEWVELTRDLFHAEFARLRRNPTGDEFAAAIKKAGLGTVSASTAKNIRAEILDRTELPALD